ncbi:MAG: NmrA family transcriptional regulator [Antricoccus sp.]
MFPSVSTLDRLDSDPQTSFVATTLITGGTGKTGHRIAELLTGRNRPIRIGSRTGHHRFDWNDQSTWGSALDGCSSAYLAYAPDLAFPGAPELIGRFAKTAVAAGTSRLVLLSGRGDQGAQHAEELVIDSGAEWTVVRCAFFAQNFSESTWVDAVRAGHFELPGDTLEPIVDADDIAEVVVAALSADCHVGQLYELTGPRLLTFAQAVREIAEATNRDISFAEITGSEFAAGLRESGMPQEEAASLAELFSEILHGHNSYLSDGVRRALGRDPHDFSDYARRTAETGIWNG